VNYWQVGQPGGHDGCWAVGVTHLGSVTGPPPDTQHSCPWSQHDVPQQNVLLAHVGSVLLQGGASQLPPLQVDFLPVHWVPQLPQFCGSFRVSTH
jgi:hypothetical protein